MHYYVSLVAKQKISSPSSSIDLIKELGITNGTKSANLILNNVIDGTRSAQAENGKKTTIIPSISTSLVIGRSSLVKNMVSSILKTTLITALSAPAPSSANPQFQSTSSFQTSTHASEMTSSVNAGIFNTYSFSSLII
jgi:hypothetical protein